MGVGDEGVSGFEGLYFGFGDGEGSSYIGFRGI